MSADRESLNQYVERIVAEPSMEWAGVTSPNPGVTFLARSQYRLYPKAPVMQLELTI